VLGKRANAEVSFFAPIRVEGEIPPQRAFTVNVHGLFGFTWQRTPTDRARQAELAGIIGRAAPSSTCFHRWGQESGNFFLKVGPRRQIELELKGSLQNPRAVIPSYLFRFLRDI